MYEKILTIASECILAVIVAFVATASSQALQGQIKKMNQDEQRLAREATHGYALMSFGLGVIVTTIVATILYYILIEA